MHNSLKILILFVSLIICFNPAFAQKAIYTDNFYDVEVVGEKVWIAGYHGTILHSTDRGQNWCIQQSNTANALFSLSLVGGKKGWAVGSSGTIVHTEDGGTTWELQSCNIKKKLFEVFFIDELSGWICGDQGTILLTDNGGKTWNDMSLNEDIALYSIWFIDGNLGWIAAEFGMIFHTLDGGRTWKKQKSPIETSLVSPDSQCLFKVRFKDRNIGFAVGMDGGVLYTRDGGDNWKLLQKTVKGHLFNIFLKDKGALSVGQRGVAALLVNNDILPLDLGVKKDLNGISFGSDGLGFIAGNKGIILRSLDGGKNWTPVFMDGGALNE